MHFSVFFHDNFCKMLEFRTVCRNWNDNRCILSGKLMFMIFPCLPKELQHKPILLFIFFICLFYVMGRICTVYDWYVYSSSCFNVLLSIIIHSPAKFFFLRKKVCQIPAPQSSKELTHINTRYRYPGTPLFKN